MAAKPAGTAIRGPFDWQRLANMSAPNGSSGRESRTGSPLIDSTETTEPARVDTDCMGALVRSDGQAS